MQLVWCIRTVMALLMGSALGEEIGEASSIKVGLPGSSVCGSVTPSSYRGINEQL